MNSDRIWILDTSKRTYLPWIWSECTAWRQLPKNLCTPVHMIYNVRNGAADIFYDPNERAACSRKTSERLASDAAELERLSSDCKTEHGKLMQVAVDLDKLDLVSLSDDVLYKVYMALLKQYAEVFKFSSILRVMSKEEKLMNEFLERGITSDYVEGALSGAVLSSNRLFTEISERLQRSEEFVMHMTPEELDCALHGGVFDELDVESRMDHYLLVYDLEKDNPHVYMDERARVMTVSLKLEKR